MRSSSTRGSLGISRVVRPSSRQIMVVHAGNPERSKVRILLLGGGIGGVAAARHLDRQLARRDDLDVTLVSRDNFFLLTPLLFEACSGVLELRQCAQPIRPCLPRARFLEGTVQ